MVEVRFAQIVSDLLARGKSAFTIAQTVLREHTASAAGKHQQSDDE
jgi:hypothetical protein